MKEKYLINISIVKANNIAIPLCGRDIAFEETEDLLESRLNSVTDLVEKFVRHFELESKKSLKFRRKDSK